MLQALAWYPGIARLAVGALHGPPGDHVCTLLAVGLTGMGAIGVVECFAIDVLRMLGKVIAHGQRQVFIDVIRHDSHFAPAGMM